MRSNFLFGNDDDGDIPIDQKPLPTPQDGFYIPQTNEQRIINASQWVQSFLYQQGYGMVASAFGPVSITNHDQDDGVVGMALSAVHKWAIDANVKGMPINVASGTVNYESNIPNNVRELVLNAAARLYLTNSTPPNDPLPSVNNATTALIKAASNAENGGGNMTSKVLSTNGAQPIQRNATPSDARRPIRWVTLGLMAAGIGYFYNKLK